MSNLTLDHPITARRQARRLVRTDVQPAPAGSYVDTDGARRTSRRVGAYVSRTSVTAVRSYPDHDGVRTSTGRGGYTRVER